MDKKRSYLVLFLVACIRGSFATDIDSSDIIFDDAKIHAYELRFYYPNWTDSLEHYKSLPDEEYIPARFVYRAGRADSVVFDSIGVRYKGNSSYNFAKSSPKKPFKFSFDKYVKGRRFFGVERLNFSNGAKDPTMMREKIAYDVIGRFMPSPRAAYATITIEGKLIGLYTQVEQVDKIFLSRHFKDNDCNLYKSSDNGSTLLYKGPNQSSYEADYELKTNETLNDWSAFIGMIDKLNNTPATEFAKTAGNCLNFDTICRYLAFNMAFSNFDSYTGSGRNFYFYEDPSTRKFTLIPWDLNLSFGSYTNNWNVVTADIVAISNLAQRPLNKRVIENDSLRRSYLSYIKNMIDGPGHGDTVAAMAGRLKPLIDSWVRADSNKLHSYEAFIQNIESDVVVTDGFSKTTIPGLKSFCVKRSAAIRTQLENYLPAINGLAARMGSGGQMCWSMISGGTVLVRYHVRGSNVPVRLSVYDGRGVLVESFNYGIQPRGPHTRSWDVRSKAPGYYLLRLSAGGESACSGIPLVR